MRFDHTAIYQSFGNKRTYISVSVHEETSDTGHWGQFLDLSGLCLPKHFRIGFNGNVGHLFKMSYFPKTFL